VKRTIRLRGMNGPIKGQLWESTDLLRVGRLEALEIVLDDSSVSRYHAEVRSTENGWRVKDLGSTNGTRLNGVRLGTGQWPVRVRDLLQFGEVAVVIEAIEEQDPLERQRLVAGSDMRVAGTARSTWDKAMEGLAYDSNRCLRAGEQLMALFRAGHHFVNIEKEEELLHSILEDAVTVLDAQRGAIVLLQGVQQQLKIKAVVNGRNMPRMGASPRGDAGGRFPFSQSLASRCVSQGESILCHRVDEDPELALAKSIAEGAMSSVLCVLLRTPRKRLGVLHLDRGPWQKAFTMDDLHLADALAANVSAGIECAQLLAKQRELFLDTITILAQAIELRDDYTGGHTQRVSAYAVLLAEHLELEPNDVEWIRLGTPLHDIGKIGIDDAILRKAGRLEDHEFELMKLHTVKGDEIVATLPDLRPIRPIVRSHHERWDGRGYPDGLSGEEICPLARVVALADAFDAMTSDRPYRRGMDPQVAFAEIERMAGEQFDPAFARVFVDIQDAIRLEMTERASEPRRQRTPCTSHVPVFPLQVSQ
jgi:HD-GYP domain-containing protein (c-di-GMP phosphodiesterase class II)